MNNPHNSHETMIAREDAITPQLANPTGRACLVKIYPAGFGEGLIDLPPHRFIVGRGQDCHLTLNDSAVSRQHAYIEPRAGNYMVVDMGSTNGSYVNDELVEKKLLVSGDLVRIGKHIMKFLSCDGIERHYHETIYSLMINDGLTGVHNKRFFREALDRELVRSQRHQRPLSLVMFDIDHFKSINDTHGHLAGDAVLRELCNRIRPAIRKDEVMARYGGEEFAVLLPEATAADARKFAERVRQLVANEPMKVNAISIPVTISIGVAETMGDTPITADELIEQADKFLYEAKRSGRNRVCG